jgi:hypothetical protein
MEKRFFLKELNIGFLLGIILENLINLTLLIGNKVYLCFNFNSCFKYI